MQAGVQSRREASGDGGWLLAARAVGLRGRPSALRSAGLQWNFFLLLHTLPAVASLSRDIYFQEALFAGAGVGGPTMDLCPHGTGLTPRMEVP